MTALPYGNADTRAHMSALPYGNAEISSPAYALPYGNADTTGPPAHFLEEMRTSGAAGGLRRR